MMNINILRFFMNDKFRADISVVKLGNINGKVYDLEMEEEYTNFRNEKCIRRIYKYCKK